MLFISPVIFRLPAAVILATLTKLRLESITFVDPTSYPLVERTMPFPASRKILAIPPEATYIPQLPPSVLLKNVAWLPLANPIPYIFDRADSVGL